MQNILEELMAKTEKGLVTYETNREYCFSIYSMLEKTFDECIRSGDYASLSSLLPYFNSSEGTHEFINTGESYRIWILIRITQLESSAVKTPFLSSASSYRECIQQYTLTIFAFRRLELALSEDSMEEARSYLQSIPLTVYAAKIISECEYFENMKRLYWNLYHCMSHRWSTADKIFWLTVLLEKCRCNEALLTLSYLYLEIGEYAKAYSYLIQIPSPSQEISNIIMSLGEHIK